MALVKLVLPEVRTHTPGSVGGTVPETGTGECCGNKFANSGNGPSTDIGGSQHQQTRSRSSSHSSSDGDFECVPSVG